MTGSEFGLREEEHGKALGAGRLRAFQTTVLLGLAACQTGIEPRRMEVAVPEEIQSVAFSPDAVDSAFFLQPANQLLYRVRRAGRWTLMAEDMPAGDYPPLEEKISKAPDRQHFAVLIATEGNQRAVIVDGRREAAFPDVDWTSFAWSPEGAAHAYVARVGAGEDSGFAVVHNGAALTTYPEIRPTSLTLSGDGQHVAYAVREGQGWSVVTDQAAGPSFEEVGDPAFAGSLAVYAARRGEEWTLQGLQMEERFLQVGSLYADSPGGRVAYAAEVEPGLWSVFVNSEVVAAPFDGVVQNSGIRFEETGIIKFVAKEGSQLVWLQAHGGIADR